ncbi:MAG: hypothetical protein ABI895_25430 [Deltaproteobacteria bacterium]
MRTKILLGLLLWAAACGDEAGRGGARPDAGSQLGPGPTDRQGTRREPRQDATVSTCDASDPACRRDGVPAQEPGLPDPAEPDSPNGPAPDPSPIDGPAPTRH